MGYSTVNIEPAKARRILKSKSIEPHSASTADLFNRIPLTAEISTAEQSDHGHIILRLKDGRFVDYEIKEADHV